MLTNTAYRASDRSVQIINDFLALTPQQLETIKPFLWDDCRLCCQASSYGFDVPDGQEETQVNHREFGVHNPDDAFNKSTLKYLLIAEDDQADYAGNYGRITFDNEWNSALTVVVMKNACVVGCGASGVYVGQFEAAG